MKTEDSNAVTKLREFLFNGDASSLEVVGRSSVNPICQIIERSCEILDRSGYEEAKGNIKSIVVQRIRQSRLVFREGGLDDAALTRVCQELCTETTREISFSMLRRGIIRPKAVEGGRLADELRIKSMLVSCEYDKFAWMLVEDILSPAVQALIPQEHYQHVRHELYYISAVEAVRLHRKVEMSTFRYGDIWHVKRKLADKTKECLREKRTPQFKVRTAMSKSRPWRN